MLRTSQDLTSRVILSHAALFFDCDGTIYRENQCVEGVAAFFSMLAHEQLSYRFLTNASHRTPEQVADKLRGYGIECASDMVLTSGTVAADFIATHCPGAQILCLGPDALHEALHDRGLRLTHDASARRPDLVLIGNPETLTKEAAERAASFIRSGSTFFGTNPDLFVVGPEGGDEKRFIEAGFWVKMIEQLSGTAPAYFGKPEVHMFEAARATLSDAATPDRILMFGDNPATDGGCKRYGYKFAHSLNGVTRDAAVFADFSFASFRPFIAR